MVRKYICTREKPKGEAVAAAIRAWKSGILTQKDAAIRYGVTRGTIYNHQNDDLDALERRDTLSQGRFKPVFTPAQEEEIKDYLLEMSRQFNGVTRFALGQIAYQLAARNHIQHPFNTSKRTAGYTWMYRFLQRNPELSLRTATPISIERVSGFNPTAVNRFFDNLEAVVRDYQFTPEKIWNMDETGITITPNRPPQVLAAKGVRSVNVIKPCERGRCVTLVACMSAGGRYIPPTFIFPSSTRPKDVEEAVEKGPQGSLALSSSTGYMKAPIFLQWLEHFRNSVSATTAAPVLLLMDNHQSHISVEAITFCRESGIVLVTIPPHTSHKLQPLDVGLYSPLKTKYSLLMSEWTRIHRPMVPRNENIPEIVRDAYIQSCSSTTAINAYRKTGIWDANLGMPNRFVFGAADFEAHKRDPRNNVRDAGPENLPEAASTYGQEAVAGPSRAALDVLSHQQNVPVASDNEDIFHLEEAEIYDGPSPNVITSVEDDDVQRFGDGDDVVLFNLNGSQAQESPELLPPEHNGHHLHVPYEDFVGLGDDDDLIAPTDDHVPQLHPAPSSFPGPSLVASSAVESEGPSSSSVGFSVGPREVDKPIVAPEAPKKTRKARKKLQSEVLTSEAYYEAAADERRAKTRSATEKARKTVLLPKKIQSSKKGKKK